MTIPSRPFLWHEVASQGMAAHEISRLVDTGALRRPFKGIYCPADIPDSIDLRARCAALILPKHVVVCDRSAAWLHGVDCLRMFETFDPPPLEVASVAGATRTRMAGIYGGERDLIPAEVTISGDVPLTTPIRTAVDLACLRGAGTALASVEALMRTCALTQGELRSQLTRHRGRRGVIQARRLIDIASAASESPGESLTKWCLIEAGLPQPAQQVVVDLPGWGVCRLDLAYPELMIAIEYDGAMFHGPREAEHDHQRRESLRRAGWTVIVVRKDDIALREKRSRWLDEVRRAVGDRRPPYRRTFPPKTPWNS